jgi:hypothetical protein
MKALIIDNPSKIKACIKDLQRIQDATRPEFLHAVKQREIIDFADILNTVDEPTLRIIAENLVAVELLDGCTGNCRFCSECVSNKITKTFSYDSLIKALGKNGAFHSNLTAPFTAIKLYEGTEPLDWYDISANKDFFALADELNEGINESNETCYTRLPDWCIADFVKHEKEAILDKTGRKTIFSISVQENNAQRAEQVLSAIIADNALKKYANTGILRKLLLTERNRENSALRSNPKVKIDTLSDLGRKYLALKNTDLDPWNANLLMRLDEGTKITPNGTLSWINAFPTKENPTGKIEYKIADGIVTKYSTMSDFMVACVHHKKLSHLLMPALKDCFVKDTPKYTALDELYREAYVFALFRTFVQQYGVFLLQYYLQENPALQNELNDRKLYLENLSDRLELINLSEYQKILKDFVLCNMTALITIASGISDKDTDSAQLFIIASSLYYAASNAEQSTLESCANILKDGKGLNKTQEYRLQVLLAKHEFNTPCTYKQNILAIRKR